MSSVSLNNGAAVEDGGGTISSLISGRVICEIKRNIKSLNNNESVPYRVSRKRESSRWICAVLPVILSLVLVLSLPEGCHAGRTKKDGGSKNGNFSQSPTNHQEVSVRNKHASTTNSGSSGGDNDYWKGSHKLEFKPHPLLMPSTQSPVSSQIPIPLIELGLLPTSTPSLLASTTSNEAAEVDDLSESATTSEEESKGKGKTRNSRGGRKKSRDQRRMAHRTLWARQNAANNNNVTAMGTAYLMRAYQQQLQKGNPYFLHNHHQMPQQPVLLTAGSMLSPQNPLLIPPLNSRTDDTFHGTATTWNINHPGNSALLAAANQLQSQPSYLQQHSVGPMSSSSSSSQESSQQVQGQYTAAPPPGTSSFQYTYPQFLQHHQQQISQQLSLSPHQQQQLLQQQAHQLPLQVPPLLGAGQQPYSMMSSGPEYTTGQHGLSPVVMSGSSGPVLMYMGPGGGGAAQISSASGPIPKPFNINEISGLGYPPHLQYNHITGPDMSQGPHLHNHPHQNSGGNGGGNGGRGGSNSGSSTNPQYLRNNFLRMFMDKLANVGRVLPIPFVTKYSSPPSSSTSSQSQQSYGYDRHNHYTRRMK